MTDSGQEQWHEVARVGDVPEDDVIQVRVGDTCLAVFNLGGRYYATAGICTHARAFLAKGYVQDDTIECPLHQGVFHIPTGRAIGAPVTKDLRIYPVKIEDGRILVGV
ncbi:non-heme iron oxygenase ferredoxin subunit [Vineibacter terrae]|uniref:non-heme iron oxygenase ferredoxin subunit n=1 Tax=Vineibacter terrae TaxID=2586908 RepID=UPI002E2FC03B|nr:non-heme iron oxygenase ferredoxin subunit [Vineibacter terrae]HEX2890927.1 non-heme iron oxygenase ferredoxin subunit [Vineibacter terrae]